MCVASIAKRKQHNSLTLPMGLKRRTFSGEGNSQVFFKSLCQEAVDDHQLLSITLDIRMGGRMPVCVVSIELMKETANKT